MKDDAPFDKIRDKYLEHANMFHIFASEKLKNDMEPQIGDMMKANPQLTGQDNWVEGKVVDVEHNPFMGLVISIKDQFGRIFFGQIKYFQTL